jgi:hypothetical protein
MIGKSGHYPTNKNLNTIKKTTKGWMEMEQP